MMDWQQFTLKWLTITLVAELVTSLQHWSLGWIIAMLLMAWVISLLVKPVLKRNEPVRAALVIFMMLLMFYRLMLLHPSPAVDAVALLLTVALWHSYLDDEWPRFKRRVNAILAQVWSALSRPVMPLPTQPARLGAAAQLASHTLNASGCR